MRRRPLWLLALLGAVIIEASLSSMVHRAIVVPGGGSVWADIGEFAHRPGIAVANAFLDIKNPLGLFLEYASGLAVWFLACWAAIAVLTCFFRHRSAEPGAAGGQPEKRR